MKTKQKQSKPKFKVGDTVYFFEDRDALKISSDKVMQVVREKILDKIYYSYFLENEFTDNTGTTLHASCEYMLFKNEKELVLNSIIIKRKNLEWFKKRYPIEVKSDEYQISKLEKMLENLSENKVTKTTGTLAKNKQRNKKSARYLQRD